MELQETEPREPKYSTVVGPDQVDPFQTYASPAPPLPAATATQNEEFTHDTPSTEKAPLGNAVPDHELPFH
jgi:hypothetical protein